MNKKTYNNDLTIIENNTLMCDNDYMDRERIKKDCRCIKSSTCQAICDLLRNKQLKWAFELLEHSKKDV